MLHNPNNDDSNNHVWSLVHRVTILNDFSIVLCRQIKLNNLNKNISKFLYTFSCSLYQYDLYVVEKNVEKRVFRVIKPWM